MHVVPGGPDPVTVTIVGGPPMAFSPAEITVGVGGTVNWINNSIFHHTVTSKQGAAMPTHCINGRGFVGNTPTIVGRSGQRIRWYVFNLDTSVTWHNFHPHAMRWKFGGEAIDIRSMGPAESFVVEAEIPPVLLLTDEEEKAQDPAPAPGATLRRLKGDFVFHCHVHHHMMNGMVGLVRARQSMWLTDDMAHEISHRTGLPLDDGTNACPDVDPHPCMATAAAVGRRFAGAPEVAFMHSVLLPTHSGSSSGVHTRRPVARVGLLDSGRQLPAAGEPAGRLSGTRPQHLGPVVGRAHDPRHGGGHRPDPRWLFAKQGLLRFDPGALTWTRVADTAEDRFYSTTR